MGGITGVMGPGDRIQCKGRDFYLLQVTAQFQRFTDVVFHVNTQIYHIILFGKASFLHTRAIFRSGRCFSHSVPPFMADLYVGCIFSRSGIRLTTRLLQTAIFTKKASTLFHPGLFTSVISHPHFLKPWMSEIPHAFQCLHSGETW